MLRLSFANQLTHPILRPRGPFFFRFPEDVQIQEHQASSRLRRGADEREDAERPRALKEIHLQEFLTLWIATLPLKGVEG